MLTIGDKFPQFKLKAVTLGPGQSLALTKKLSLAEMTTRRHQPGLHRAEVLVNGQALPLGGFELLPALRS